MGQQLQTPEAIRELEPRTSTGKMHSVQLPASISFHSGPPGRSPILLNADDCAAATKQNAQLSILTLSLPAACQDGLALKAHTPEVTPDPWNSPSCALKNVWAEYTLPARLTRKSFFQKDSAAESNGTPQEEDSSLEKAMLVDGSNKAPNLGPRRSPRLNQNIKASLSFEMDTDH